MFFLLIFIFSILYEMNLFELFANIKSSFSFSSRIHLTLMDFCVIRNPRVMIFLRIHFTFICFLYGYFLESILFIRIYYNRCKSDFFFQRIIISLYVKKRSSLIAHEAHNLEITSSNTISPPMFCFFSVQLLNWLS